ncbi:transmembrane protein 42 [Macrosteles quadrilineatus]|uniref:transmembrane protein 42 n=1 Tax=Macrosteles quadrilineatus TaxID=74068 RepID=UPI0023E1B425|nr:transmembrane protein 42 [Macrosteles quadrilineatus]
MDLSKLPVNEQFHYSFQAGLLSCGGSVFGKLSNVKFGLIDNEVAQYIVSALCLVLMIICNAAVWTFFVKALQESPSTFIPTISVAAVNYISSALIGWLLFGESVSTMWFVGTSLIIGGLALLASDSAKEKVT